MNNHEKQEPNIIKSFAFEGKEEAISFVESTPVTDGVVCDVYNFNGDTTKDLGIIRIKPGSKTPLQKVLKGDRTIEGYVSGKGKLTVTKGSGKEVFNVGQTSDKFAKTVGVGEVMQWEADEDSDLVVYEVCFPPYQDGRFENLS